MTEDDRIRREDHVATRDIQAMVRTLMQGQTDNARIVGERMQRQDDRIERISTETAQQNRELIRAGRETAEMRGEIKEMRAAFEKQFENLHASIRPTDTRLIVVVVTLATAFVQFVVPAMIEKWP